MAYASNHVFVSIYTNNTQSEAKGGYQELPYCNVFSVFAGENSRKRFLDHPHGGNFDDTNSVIGCYFRVMEMFVINTHL